MNDPTPSTAARFARLPASSLVLTIAAVGCATGDAATPTIVGTGPSASDPAANPSITVSIDSIEGDDGSVRVALYSTAESFDANEPFASISEPATASALTVSFEDVPDGDYAVMLFHDVNGNETLDRNLLGIPREPWAGSLNGRVLGPPSWHDVRFEVDGADLALALSL